jgi:hypothetical protein
MRQAYLRATKRELGLPEGELNQTYQEKALETLAKAELRRQINWHRENVASMTALYTRLHHSGDACFIATAIVLAVFLALSFYVCPVQSIAECHVLDRYAFIFPFFTAFLPALGATFAGIRFTGDFDGYAKRSQATLDDLEKLKDQYELVRKRLEFDLTADYIFRVAQTMAADINGWATLYSRKNLVFPG